MIDTLVKRLQDMLMLRGHYLYADEIAATQEAIAALSAAPAQPDTPQAGQPDVPLVPGDWPLIALGRGLIEVAEGYQEGTPALIFGRNGTGKIGEPTQSNRAHLPGETLAVVTFDNSASLDVVAAKLATIRAKMADAAPRPAMWAQHRWHVTSRRGSPSTRRSGGIMADDLIDKLREVAYYLRRVPEWVYSTNGNHCLHSHVCADTVDEAIAALTASQAAQHLNEVIERNLAAMEADLVRTREELARYRSQAAQQEPAPMGAAPTPPEQRVSDKENPDVLARTEDEGLPGMLALAQGVAAQRWPHTVDAREWVKAWLDYISKQPGIASDEDAMLGWFANAIMAGYDTAAMRCAAPQQRTGEGAASQGASVQSHGTVATAMQCPACGRSTAPEDVHTCSPIAPQGGGR